MQSFQQIDIKIMIVHRGVRHTALVHDRICIKHKTIRLSIDNWKLGGEENYLPPKEGTRFWFHFLTISEMTCVAQYNVDCAFPKGKTKMTWHPWHAELHRPALWAKTESLTAKDIISNQDFSNQISLLT